MNVILLVVPLTFLAIASPGGNRSDILIADFEGKDWGAWKTTGEAFGPGPAKGTLPNQMPVTGYLGKGLVNSYQGGDKATGTLTSPAFTIERKFVNFLIGGGKYPGKTCMNLLVKDKVVRTATGPNDRPGGSEHLDWQSWDVSEFAGQQATLQMIDDRTEGWGHICVDHIVLSDRKKQSGPAQRELVVEQQYLHLPVKTGGPKRRMRLVVDDQIVREFDIELADSEPSFWAFSDMTAFKGKKLRIEVNSLPDGSTGLSSIAQSAALKDGDKAYQEKNRPQFHFTSQRGWLNDPNGLVYAKGEYHLFYQHNPFGWNWDNMHWGHAVSTDLFHWKEQPTALYPKRYGDWAFSGSAVVDRANTGGFKSGKEDVLVAFFTSTGRGECVVYSHDLGRTWTEYEGNPVVKHAGRDPKVVWHEGAKQWVMSVYDEHQGKRWIAFYTAPDLKKWTLQSRIEGFYECPDLFELPVDGDARKSQWVLYAADGKYVLGTFDGKTFQAAPGKHQLWYGNFYAAQTYSDAPDGRRIQIGWAQGITFPGMPFNQQMTVPCELTLRTTPDGVRMFAQPVKELATLDDVVQLWKAQEIPPGKSLREDALGELLNLQAEFEPGKAEGFTLTVRGVAVAYDAKKQQLLCNGRSAPLAMVDGKIRLQLLVDRASVEVFGNDGRVALSVGAAPTGQAVEVTARGGAVAVRVFKMTSLKSAW